MQFSGVQSLAEQLRPSVPFSTKKRDWVRSLLPRDYVQRCERAEQYGFLPRHLAGSWCVGASICHGPLKHVLGAIVVGVVILYSSAPPGLEVRYCFLQ